MAGGSDDEIDAAMAVVAGVGQPRRPPRDMAAHAAHMRAQRGLAHKKKPQQLMKTAAVAGLGDLLPQEGVEGGGHRTKPCSILDMALGPASMEQVFLASTPVLAAAAGGGTTGVIRAQLLVADCIVSKQVHAGGKSKSITTPALLSHFRIWRCKYIMY